MVFKLSSHGQALADAVKMAEVSLRMLSEAAEDYYLKEKEAWKNEATLADLEALILGEMEPAAKEYGKLMATWEHAGVEEGGEHKDKYKSKSKRKRGPRPNILWATVMRGATVRDDANETYFGVEGFADLNQRITDGRVAPGSIVVVAKKEGFKITWAACYRIDADASDRRGVAEDPDTKVSVSLCNAHLLGSSGSYGPIARKAEEEYGKAHEAAPA